MSKLKDNLEKWLELSNHLPEQYIENDIIQYIYNKNKEKTAGLFLKLQGLERKEMKAKLLDHYHASREGISNVTIIANELLKGNTREAKKSAKYLFEENNVASIIHTIKIHFPDGNADGESVLGHWYFDKFVDMIINNKEKYSKGGDFYGWMETYGHVEYIEMIIKKYKNGIKTN